MTITQAIPKKAEVTHLDRQTSEKITEAWRRVHITAWEFEGNIRPTNWTEDSLVRRVSGQASTVGVGGRRVVEGKASTQESGLQDSGWAAMENEKDTTLTAITLGSKYFSYARSPAPSHTQTLSNPFRNLTNKVRGKIFYKEVFLRLYHYPCVCYSCVRRLSLRRYVSSIYIYMYISAWISRWQYNRDKSICPLE